MPHVLEAELQELIDSGSYSRVPVIDITLGDGTTLEFGREAITVDGRTYLARLRPSGALSLSLTAEVDRKEIEAHNLDKTLGQTVTGATNKLDGARATLGVVYVNTDEAHPLFGSK